MFCQDAAAGGAVYGLELAVKLPGCLKDLLIATG
jgi:hypothetical protein